MCAEAQMQCTHNTRACRTIFDSCNRHIWFWIGSKCAVTFVRPLQFKFFLCSRHECLNRSRTTRLIHIKCIDRSHSTNWEHYSQTSFQMQTQGIWIPFGIAPFSVQWMLWSVYLFFVFYYRMLPPTYQSPGCWFSHVEVSLLNWIRAWE